MSPSPSSGPWSKSSSSPKAHGRTRKPPAGQSATTSTASTTTRGGTPRWAISAQSTTRPPTEHKKREQHETALLHPRLLRKSLSVRAGPYRYPQAARNDLTKWSVETGQGHPAIKAGKHYPVVALMQDTYCLLQRSPAIKAGKHLDGEAVRSVGLGASKEPGHKGREAHRLDPRFLAVEAASKEPGHKGREARAAVSMTRNEIRLASKEPGHKGREAQRFVLRDRAGDHASKEPGHKGREALSQNGISSYGRPCFKGARP